MTLRSLLVLCTIAVLLPYSALAGQRSSAAKWIKLSPKGSGFSVEMPGTAKTQKGQESKDTLWSVFATQPHIAYIVSYSDDAPAGRLPFRDAVQVLVAALIGTSKATLISQSNIAL